MPSQKCVAGTEATNDALVAIVDKALAYPRRGVNVGGGIHVDNPPAWDGQGETPPGWTKHATANWVASALSSFVPITDALAASLQAAPAQARLIASEIAALAASIAARAQADPEAQGASPKANAAALAARNNGNEP